MRFATLVGIAGVALMSTTAFAQSVSYDYDRSADFGGYKTYSWVPGTSVDDVLNHKRIMSAVDAQMALKGFTRVERATNPDILIAYHATFSKNLEINGFSSGWGGYRFGPGQTHRARVDEIVTGTLVIDLVDARSNTIVWRGTATKEIDVDAKPENRDKSINKAAEKLFKNYPTK